jgi:hypothetical protein
MNINWDDPFYGLMLGMGMLLLIGLYLVIFGEVAEKKPKRDKKSA